MFKSPKICISKVRKLYPK